MTLLNSVRTFRTSFRVDAHILTFSPPIPVQDNVKATIKAIYHDKAFVGQSSSIPESTVFGILLDRTSFYAEAGGQEYDTGSIVIDGVAEFEVINVQAFKGYVLHIGSLKYGELSVGDEVVASYDEVRTFTPPV